MTTKAELVAEFLVARAAEDATGAWIASVASLQTKFDASIGTVSKAVDLAVSRGASLERRRGPAGGYYVADPQRNNHEPFPTEERDLTLAESALIEARRIRAQLDALVATLELVAG